MEGKAIKSNSFLVPTNELAKAFGVSDRRILQLVEAGIIETVPGSGRSKVFDLENVVPQYAAFLTSGVPLKDWAPDK